MLSVKWVGYGIEHNTWQRSTGFTCDGKYKNTILEKFLDNNPEAAAIERGSSQSAEVIDVNKRTKKVHKKSKSYLCSI